MGRQGSTELLGEVDSACWKKTDKGHLSPNLPPVHLPESSISRRPLLEYPEEEGAMGLQLKRWKSFIKVSCLGVPEWLSQLRVQLLILAQIMISQFLGSSSVPMVRSLLGIFSVSAPSPLSVSMTKKEKNTQNQTNWNCYKPSCEFDWLLCEEKSPKAI